MKTAPFLRLRLFLNFHSRVSQLTKSVLPVLFPPRMTIKHAAFSTGAEGSLSFFLLNNYDYADYELA